MVATLPRMRALLAGGLILALCACASRPPLELTREAASSCLAEGGYESRTPFGAPFCQKLHADAGTPCVDKAECQGRCLAEALDLPSVAVGTPAVGHCEARRATFGCHAVIEHGKVATYRCVD